MYENDGARKKRGLSKRSARVNTIFRNSKNIYFVKSAGLSRTKGEKSTSQVGWGKVLINTHSAHRAAIPGFRELNPPSLPCLLSFVIGGLISGRGESMCECTS